MTIIVYSPSNDTIYVDSKHTFSNGKAPFIGSKISECGEDGYYALAGNGHSLVIASLLIDKHMTHRSGNDSVACCHVARTGLDKTQQCKGYLRLNTCVFEVTIDADSFVIAPPEVDFEVACGSGSHFFNAYRALHPEYSTQSVVEMVANFHDGCGMPVEGF